MPRQLLCATAAVALLTLAACGDGNPFEPEPPTTLPDATEEEDDTTIPPPDPVLVIPALDEGTTRAESDPDAPLALHRSERGSQVAQVTFDAENDAFLVQGLFFDGENRYAPAPLASANLPHAVYEGDHQVNDFLTNVPIGQIIPYYALYGESDNDAASGAPRTSFAIIRTGGLMDLGPGGFFYSRDGALTLPEPGAGQAEFTGDYSGIRIFDGAEGVEFTRADVAIEIDFRETDTALAGRIFNRVAYAEDGTLIPLSAATGDGLLLLPDIRFSLPGAGGNVNSEGEFAGTAISRQDSNGRVVDYETGTYYGVIAGNLVDRDDGGEIVGVIVLDSTDPRTQASVQETGGFIANR